MSDNSAFKQAVARIYSDTCPETERRSAEEWLTSWRKHPSAWSTADSILHDASTTGEEKYMAAHTLCTKTQRDFEELKPEEAAGLRDSLVTLLVRYGPGPRAVRMQLCVAIAAMAVHVPSEQFGDGGVIGWLFSKLQRESDSSVAVVCMLEFLATLPQEVSNYRVAVRPERRRHAEHELRGMLGQVLATMESALNHAHQSGGPAVTEEVLRAFAQWMQLARGQGIGAEALRRHKLVHTTYAGLQTVNDSVFETAADALEELIYCSVFISNDGLPQPRSGLEQLIMELINCVLSLRPRYLLALKRASNESQGRSLDHGIPPEECISAFNGSQVAVQDRAELYDDEDTVKCIVRLFLNACEAFSALIAACNDQALELLDFLVHICMHPSLDLFKMSVWTVGKVAVSVREWRGMHGYPSEVELRIRSAYEKLVAILSSRCRFPDDFERQTWEERSSYKGMRNDIEDVLRDCSLVIGPASVLSILVKQLEDAVPLANGQSGWRSIEAAYHCLGAVRDESLPHGNELLLKILTSIPDSPSEPKLQYTACTLLRKYAPWLAGSALEAPELSVPLLPRLFRYCISALHDNLSAGGASLAFASLCSLFAPTIARHCEAELMDSFQKAVKVETWRGRERDSGHAGAWSAHAGPLEEEDVCSIIEGTAIVLAHEVSQNQPEATQKLQQCMTQLITPLNQLAATCSTSGSFPQPRTLHHYAAMDLTHRVAVFFENLGKCPEVVGAAMPKTWTFVVRFVELAASQESVVESALKIVIKALAVSRGASCEQWLPGILDFIPQAFSRTHFPVYLYLASHVLRTCGTTDSPHWEVVVAKIKPMITLACSRLSSLAVCNQLPNDTDDLFLMAFKGLLHTPHVFLEREVLMALVATALRAMLVQQPDAFKSVQSFLWRLFDVRTLEKSHDRMGTQALLQDLMRQYGPMLFRLELAGVVGAVQRSGIPDIANTVFQMAMATADAGRQWLQEAVALLPESCATPSDKRLLLQCVSQACMVDPSSHEQIEQSIWAVKEALSELADTCRRTPRIQSESERALAPQELWADLQLL